MTPHRCPTSWRQRLFRAGLFAGAAGWLLLTTDLVLAYAYGWHTSIMLAAVLHGTSFERSALLCWAAFVLIALHAED